MATIRNPVEWGWIQMKAAGHHLGLVREAVSGHEEVPSDALPVARIERQALKTALQKGLEDFGAARSDVVFICLIYPLIGLLLVRVTFHEGLLPLLFPILSGFALLGPVAAVGLYEMSRRRERGETVSWLRAVSVLGAPAFGAILTFGIVLLTIFLLWLTAAQVIYLATLGPEPPASIGSFIDATIGTPAGWAMIVIGGGVGFLFAVLVLAISVVSVPLMLDRDVGMKVAVLTSIRATRKNPVAVALWGLTVAVLLVLGSLPALLGLIVVMPVLGHATWHLYRALVPSGEG